MAALGIVKDIGEALPGLQVAQHGGRLVPFVGAGISRPHCRGWPQFIDALYETFGAPPADPASASDPESLYRTADRVAAWLRLLPADERRARLRAALHDPGASALPPQALALASFAWPLIITTNYDDVVRRSLRHHFRRGVRILGRSAPHCVQVVRALDALDDPIIWYLQGHLGSDDESGPPSRGRDDKALLDEVVVGHQQYQHAINSSQSFRRAFSEVFRRRSLLFVGSGLAESYFVNLIAETLYSLGPSGQPHFALFCDADLKDRVDPDFLAVRLGITPIRYGRTHADLPGVLEALADKDAGGHRKARLPGITNASYNIPRAGPGPELQDLTVSLRFGHIDKPSTDGCVILSVGRDKHGARFRPGLGMQATSFLRSYLGSEHAASFLDVPSLPQGRMFRLHVDGKSEPVFCLAARELNDQQDDDARSLAAITEATTDALTAVGAEGFTNVSMGLMAAGPSRADKPPYCLIAQLSGIRVFAERSGTVRPSVESIGIDIIDQNVWSTFAQGRIPVLELLASRFARVLVRVSDDQGLVEEFALSVPHDSTVGDVLAAYRISDERITVAARPLPSKNAAEMRGVRVFPGMVIDVCPLA